MIVTLGAPPAPIYGPSLSLASSAVQRTQRLLGVKPKGKKKAAAGASSPAAAPAAPASRLPWILGGVAALGGILWYFHAHKGGRRGRPFAA